MTREKGPKPDPKFLSAQQVADRYGLTKNWVYHCEELQNIAVQFGKYLRYPVEGVEAYEKSRAHSRPHKGKYAGSLGYDLPWRAKVQKLKKEKEAASKVRFVIAEEEPKKRIQ